MKYFFLRSSLIILSALLLNSCGNSTGKKEKSGTVKTDISAWITSPSANVLFMQSDEAIFFKSEAGPGPVITVDPSITYQVIDGFGNCLTGGSATLIHKMSDGARKELLNELFDSTGNNIRISYLRISLGASDLSEHEFTYDDMPAGKTDTGLTGFSIEAEKKDLIPVLREILAINPGIKILASPWSAPAWMKTNGSLKGGSLKQEYFKPYALYFVKYIKAMQAEGINIDAITIQNEPLNPANNPSMFMTSADQALFIKSALGPAFRDAGISTKIIVYDHNADKTSYPMDIYADAEAGKYVDGAAFHLYGGNISDLTPVHDKYPSKNLYFTEQWVGAPGNMAGDFEWHLVNLVIGATRNWCRNVLEWNLAADSAYNPHTEGGCTECLGAVTIDSDKVTRNPAYYIIAHASKFVSPGSVRIDSNIPEGLPNVAFVAPGGRKVLVVYNESAEKKDFTLKDGNRFAALSLPGKSGATFVW